MVEHDIRYILVRGRAIFRLVLLFLWLFVIIVPTYCCWRLGFIGLGQRLSRLWHCGALFIINVRAYARGCDLLRADSDCGVLLIGNHISYLDIVVLGALFPCRFVAKSEVEGWFLLGLMAKLQHSIFVRRDSRQSLPDAQAQIYERAFEGYPYIVFAEGTSSSGNYILPFRSSFMQLAMTGDGGLPLMVQAFSLQYCRVNGMPMDRYHRPLFGWYGDTDLAPHMWDLLSLSSAEVEVRLAEPLVDIGTMDRKVLTCKLQEQSQKLLEESRMMV